MYRPDHFLSESEVPTANLRNISPGYFAAIQTPLIAGTEFTESERHNPNNAVVSQKAAQAAWPEGRPLGRTLKMNGRVSTVSGLMPMIAMSGRWRLPASRRRSWLRPLPSR